MTLPPLNALRAFEAAARHASFLAAAEELNVTPAAISHQIKALEAHIGTPLFHRKPRGVEPTEAARELLPDISKGFAHFARAIGAITGGTLAGPLTVTCATSLATLWLTPRLDGFLTSFPEIRLQLRAVETAPDLTRDEADLRIAYGAGHYPGLVTRPLMRDTTFPVCAPALLNRRPFRSLADLRHHTLLQDVAIDSAEPTESWRRWLRDAGLPDLAPAGLLEVNSAVLLVQAAVAGIGVALARRSLVGQHLANGRLVRPLKAAQPSDYAYYAITTEAGGQRPRVRAFLRWLEDEVAPDAAT